ncbi:MAG: hypothetical protein WBM90_13145 [Acidimicrobiia bacterium]
MSDPTPRQVLYALVAAGFLGVVLILVVGSAVAGLSPVWWTWVMSLVLVGEGVWLTFNWRRTGPALLMAIFTLVLWTVGTLLVA